MSGAAGCSRGNTGVCTHTHTRARLRQGRRGRACHVESCPGLGVGSALQPCAPFLPACDGKFATRPAARGQKTQNPLFNCLQCPPLPCVNKFLCFLLGRGPGVSRANNRGGGPVAGPGSAAPSRTVCDRGLMAPCWPPSLCLSDLHFIGRIIYISRPLETKIVQQGRSLPGFLDIDYFNSFPW